MADTNLSPVSNIARFWGKTDQDGSSFHPALFHMLDVGHVAGVLLGEEAPPRMRQALARAFGSRGEELQTWLPLVVALHDIGKISAPFQGQDTNRRTQIQRNRLLNEDLNFGMIPRDERHPHSTIGAVYLSRHLPQIDPPLPKLFARVMTDAINGHHGIFADRGALNKTQYYMEHIEPPEWTNYRHNAYHVLASQLAPTWSKGLALPEQVNCRAATLMLTGFIILCDWIGSDERQFHITDPATSLEEYVQLSRARAHHAVQHAGFLMPRKPVEYGGFAALFPTRPPRPMQSAVDDLPVGEQGQPALYIVEGPTGEGKTELALALARRLAAIGCASDELYFGLPTMATSNQMFGRVHNYVGRVYGVGHGVKLIHGQAYLIEDDLRLSLLGDTDAADPQGASAPAALQWFAPKKKALLWPFGVGTVDQVELTTLNTRHYMLRLFGLAGKVVIIDEVHAYDVYMSTILQSALRWLATLGTSVILLSATLPAERHKMLAKSFCEGLSLAVEPSTDEPPQALPYPALAAYTEQGAVVLSPPASQPDRKLQIQFIPDSGADAVARRLLELVRAGGAVCYISNTVRHAQETYSALKSFCPSDVRLMLAHSRFPAEERANLEAEIGRLFGPESTRGREDRFIVIGTQVLEQSLDVDFDVMISDMAPVDLLLQRAGRMHRHERPANLRPPGHQSPRLLVRLPVSEEDGKPDFSDWNSIYDEYVQWRSWLTLLGRGAGGEEVVTITLPADYRPLIESAYSTESTPTSPDTPFFDLISEAYKEYKREESKQEGEAKTRLIPYPDPISSIIQGTNTMFKEDEDGGSQGWGFARTRLGDERITIIPLYKVGDQYAVDPEGQEVVGADLPKNCDLQLRLLQRSIPFSGKTLVPKLLKTMETAPSWFRDAPRMKNTALLGLDGTGSALVEGTKVTLDPQLGLVIKY